jgi:predicted MPP superfamily phosphohydrolase
VVSLLRLFVVAALAATVWALALGSLVRWIARALRRSDKPVPGWRRRVEIASVVLGGLGVLALAYSILVEPYWPQVTHTPVASSKVHERLRIVHLSDLHSDPTERLEHDIPAIVRGLEPDLVVFTGDAINSEQGLPNFRSCMRSIASRHPTYGVLGNWEAWWFTGLDVFKGTGVVELDGTGTLLDLNGNPVWLAGTAVENESAIGDSLAGAPQDAYTIVLHHYAAMAERAARLGADLVLSGDTHGGQIRVPPLGALIRVSRHGVWLPAGIHRIGGSHLYVSRGIGMEGGRVPRVRFLCRPEIALIDVLPGGS